MNDYLYMAGSDFSSTLIWRYNLSTKGIDSLYALVPTTGLFNITGEKKSIYIIGGVITEWERCCITTERDTRYLICRKQALQQVGQTPKVTFLLLSDTVIIEDILL